MEKRFSDKNIGVVQMLVCAFLWSTAGVLFKFIPWNAFVIAGSRAFVSGIIVLLYMFARGIKPVLNRRSFYAGLAMSLTCILFVCANKLTTAANAIVLQYTAPVFLMLYSALFFRQTFRRADIFAVGLTMAGVSLFFLDRLAPGRMIGNSLAVAAGASMGAMFLLIGKAKPNERLSSILVSASLTAVTGLPFLFTTTVEISWIPILFIVLLGVFQLGIPYILYILAAERCPPLACSLLGALEPLLNPIWVMLFTGETPGLYALAGGFVVILTITMWCARGEAQPAGETAGL